jgi:pilus assembly protein CpaC
MARRTLRAAALVMAPLTLVAALDGAAAPREPAAGSVKMVASEFGSNFIPLGVGKSVVVDLARDVKDVLVADPKIANAVIRTARRAYLIGTGIGQTNIYFFDAEGRQVAGFDIAVTRDLNGMRGLLRQMFPGGNVQVEGVGDGVVLSGVVATATESQHVFDIAGRLVGDNAKVVNGLIVRGRDQVMLKVTVAEVKRDVIKQLGIDLSGGPLSKGTAVLNFATNNPFSAALQTISNTNVTGTFSSVTGTLRAMERAGVIRTLAEPTLTAISGESATFLAGGELPYPKTFSCGFSTFSSTNIETCQTGIDYKKFGVSLTFTPVVLGEGRISLKVMTEVSDLSTDNSLTLSQAGTQSFGSTATTIPSFRVRRADTTVEIPSGGALALAGMIEEQTKQSVAQADLSRPDDGFADAPDPQTVLLGRLNRLYHTSGSTVRPDPSRSYRGTYGFILE